MRTCAELLRHLSQKNEVDAEAKDMAATLVFCMRKIADGIDGSAQAWEKRDYWIKAERFRTKWMWSANIADNLEDIIRNDAWDLLPTVLIELFPYFSDIRVAKFTRKAHVWEGAHARLVSNGHEG